jgi:hypothetical protein
MGKFERTCELMSASWNVLRKDKEILLFPVLSGIALIFVMASFAVPLFMIGDFKQMAASGTDCEPWIALFLFYFSNYLVIIFFNTAIVACATIRMSGGDPVVSDGLRAASNRLPAIFGWAAISATVGMILRMIENRSSFIGRIVAGLLGMAWSITSYLVIPVLVNENKGPIEAYQESVRLLKKTWGEELIGNFSFGLVFFVLSLPVILLVFAGLLMGKGALTLIFVCMALLYGVLLSVIQSALQGVFQAALYQYAQKGIAVPGFNQNLLKDAITPKYFG